MQLRNLLERYKRAGNLTAALLVQTEMENPDPARALPADKPIPEFVSAEEEDTFWGSYSFAEVMESGGEELVLLEPVTMKR